MIQSLSDKHRKNRIKRRRIALISLTVGIILLWFFLRPLFLFIADPFVLAYNTVSSTLYAKYQKVETFFISKHKTLTYIQALEEENSRLHNRLALFEHNDCFFREQVTTINNTLSSTSTLSISSTTSFLIEEKSSILVDPCHYLILQKKEEIQSMQFLQVSPVLPKVSLLFDTIRINKGAIDGVEEGDVVFTRGMIVVGRVLSVSKHSALVELYSKQDVELYGTLSSGNSFKVVGSGGGSYVASVPKGVTVKQGEKVAFTWDQDLLLGEVVNIDSEKQDVSQKIFIRGGFNPSQLPVMYIKNHE